MIEYFIIGFLCFVIVAQHWAIQTLMNKLMARDYQNYAETTKSMRSKPTRPEPPLVGETTDPASERQAQELNSIFGMV